MIVSLEVKLLGTQTYSVDHFKDLKVLDLSLIPLYFGVTMCLFEGKSMILSLYAEVDRPTYFWKQVVIVLTVMTMASMGVGLLSYFTFGNDLGSIILYNLPPNDKLAIFIKLMYMVTIMGVYIVAVIPICKVIEKYECYAKNKWMPKDGKFVISRSLLAFCILLISIVFPSVSVLLSLTGSILGTLISIVLPVLFYNKAYEHSERKSTLK